MKSKDSKGIYKNEVSKPEQPPMHEISPKEMGWEWAGDADEAAYGAAGEAGCRSDDRKMKAQFKNYSWD